MNDDEQVIYFGETDARNKRIKFGIKRKDRSRHLYAIGKTGMGKSTLLENLAVQDIQNGDGLAFIDPHGKSADLLLEYVPKERMKDVVYFAPFDMEYPISFNVMEDVGPERRYLVANGLMSAFKKIWVDAWSARMEYILGNIMLALLEYPGSTLISVNRMLTDKDFRKDVVNNISDPSVKSFWVNEYANYTDKFAAEAAPAIQNKVGQFVANPLIRNIIGQPKSTFDIREVMDNKKILIVNLAKGRVGEANANLLGSMIITKIYLAAMSRADLNERELKAAPNFYMYVDEFQSFANESFADILSEARKYKLNLLIAHQYIEQMTEEVRAAVFGNVGTMCVYRVGATDAEYLEKEFAPMFTAEDLVNLQKYQMYLKLMIDGVTSQPFSAAGMPPIPRPEINYMKDIIDMSRAQYARPRAEIEEEIKAWHEVQYGKGGQSSAPTAYGPQKGNSSHTGGQKGGNGSSHQGGGHGSGSQNGGSNNGGGQGGFTKPHGGQNNGSSGGTHISSNQSNQVSGGAGASGFQNRFAGGANSGNDTRRFGGQGEVAARGQSAGNHNSGTHVSNGTNNMSNTNRGASFGAVRFDDSNSSTNKFDGANNRFNRVEGSAGQPGRNTFSPNRQKDSVQNREEANKRENDFRKAISLSYLKNPEPEIKNDAKAPQPENLAALRDALLSVMKPAESVTPTASDVLSTPTVSAAPSNVETVNNNVSVQREVQRSFTPHTHHPHNPSFNQYPNPQPIDTLSDIVDKKHTNKHRSNSHPNEGVSTNNNSRANAHTSVAGHSGNSHGNNNSNNDRGNNSHSHSHSHRQPEGFFQLDNASNNNRQNTNERFSAKNESNIKEVSPDTIQDIFNDNN